MTLSRRLCCLAALALASVPAPSLAQEEHAAAGCPYDKLWIGGSCPRVHSRSLVRANGCCIGGGREGCAAPALTPRPGVDSSVLALIDRRCPANCGDDDDADGSCTCRTPCDPPRAFLQPPCGDCALLADRAPHALRAGGVRQWGLQNPCPRPRRAASPAADVRVRCQPSQHAANHLPERRRLHPRRGGSALGLLHVYGLPRLLRGRRPC